MKLPHCSHDQTETKLCRKVLGYCQLTALLAGVAIFSSCGSPPATSSDKGPEPKPDISGETGRDDIEERDGIWYLKGGDSVPLTDTVVGRFGNGKIAVIQQFKDGRLEGIEEEWLKDGTKKRETHYRGGEAYFQAMWRGDGSKKIETGMQGGVPHGTHKRWHANGKLGFVGEFYEGKFHGLQVDHDENGVLLMKARYDKGTLVEDLMPAKD